jgi:Tfp pilus assembly protein PilE
MSDVAIFFLVLSFIVSILAILLAIAAMIHIGELKKVHDINVDAQINNNAGFHARIFVLENRASFKVVK